MFIFIEFPLKKLREETLHILMASELVAPQGPDDINLSVPGATQYLQSLTHIAISICVESPHLWEFPESEGFQRDLLERLLQCPHYEVRLFALEHLLRRLQKTEEKSQDCGQGPLPFDLSVSSLTSMALHETYPGCQAKVRKLQFCVVLLHTIHKTHCKNLHKENTTQTQKTATLQNDFLNPLQKQKDTKRTLTKSTQNLLQLQTILRYIVIVVLQFLSGNFYTIFILFFFFSSVQK